MTAHEIRHWRWGSNLANQLSADVASDYGEDGSGYKTVTVQRLLGGAKQKKQYVGYVNRPATDDDSVKRQFHHRCGLLKIVMAPQRNGPMFVAFLDGHVTSNFVSSEMEFRFAPDVLKENDGKPIAEVWFSGTGKRHGPLHNYGTSRIICTFADKEQMDQCLDLTNRRMPKSITHQGVTYDATSGGQYQSGDGSILPYLVVMYFLLPSNEQQAFVTQNPEVRSLLGDTLQDVSTVAGAADADNQTPADGADYGDQGDQPGGGDTGDGDGGGGGGGGGE